MFLMGCKVVLIKMTRLFDRHRIMCLTLTSTAFKISRKRVLSCLGWALKSCSWIFSCYMYFISAAMLRKIGTRALIPKPRICHKMPQNCRKVSRACSQQS